MHSDLKLDNILEASNGAVLISDLGIGTMCLRADGYMDSVDARGGGTLSYMVRRTKPSLVQS